MNNLIFLLGDPNNPPNTPNTTCPYVGAGNNCLAGSYWSSTEFSASPQTNAWYQLFATGGGSDQYNAGKNFQIGVRCSRAF